MGVSKEAALFEEPSSAMVQTNQAPFVCESLPEKSDTGNQESTKAWARVSHKSSTPDKKEGLINVTGGLHPAGSLERRVVSKNMWPNKWDSFVFIRRQVCLEEEGSQIDLGFPFGLPLELTKQGLPQTGASTRGGGGTHREACCGSRALWTWTPAGALKPKPKARGGVP